MSLVFRRFRVLVLAAWPTAAIFSCRANPGTQPSDIDASTAVGQTGASPGGLAGTNGASVGTGVAGQSGGGAGPSGPGAAASGSTGSGIAGARGSRTAGSAAIGGRGAAGAGQTAGSRAGTSGASGSGVAAGTGSGNAGGTSGTTDPTGGPCDLYAGGNTPCVAAHSTVRALYAAYDGNLYQVRRASDNTTKDIGVLSPGGLANAATQEAFCSGSTCTISIIYDQSPKHNHLSKAPAGGAKQTPDNEASATGLKLTVGGHAVYAVFINAGMGYRNDRTSGIATGDQPEGEYMVTSGKHFNTGCCFDYGNAETSNNDDGNGTMEAIYFGNSTNWGKGAGTGPWVMADLENGLFAGQSVNRNDNNTPLTSDYVTAMIKGRMGHFAIRGGNAQSGPLKTMYDGGRPTTAGYNPMKKQGAIILGIGGDNSNSAVGTFFEGAITSGYPTDAIDDAVQANISAVGYGK